MAHDDDDAVGYKRPPKHSRFKKGQSGNPRGRPKRTRNLKTDLVEELCESIRVKEGGREYQVSKQRAVLKSLVAAAIKGNMRAASAVISLCARTFAVEDEDEHLPLSSSDQRVLDDFIDREIARRKLSLDTPPNLRIEPHEDNKG